MAELSLVVPCFNEAKRLDLEQFATFFRSNEECSVLFVDDGSRDGTREMLMHFAEQHSTRARVLALPENRGKAEAVRQGLLAALDSATSLVGFWDADLATPLETIPDFLGTMRRNPDIDWVIGARVQLLGRNIRRRPIRHYLGRVFATGASIVLDMPVYDTQCGAKMFRASGELREVLNRPFVSRWVFDVEMIARLDRIRRTSGGVPAEKSIFELPLQQWVDVAGSKVKSTDFLRASLELLAIWRDSR